MRQVVREQFGGFCEGIAVGVKPRRDHDSHLMSDDFQCEIRFLSLESSPAFVRGPEGNGSVERFRTLKKQLPCVFHFDTLARLTEALKE
ncbi:MAG: hypothetical protein KatS3mg005_0789 [Bryobacteraceae bacterium]|nr:MAG: hypothetical protein KatS3mg005_0789 [Bryobacteraceae bacterium]